MAPRMGAVLRAPGKLCSFSYVLFVFLLFYVLDVVSITVYDRDRHLNPLCGLQKRGDAADAENEENELAFSSD